MYQYWYDYAHSNFVRTVNSITAMPIVLMNSKQESFILLNQVFQLIVRPKQNYRMKSILKFYQPSVTYSSRSTSSSTSTLCPNGSLGSRNSSQKDNSFSVSSTDGAIHALHLNQKNNQHTKHDSYTQTKHNLFTQIKHNLNNITKQTS